MSEGHALAWLTLFIFFQLLPSSSGARRHLEGDSATADPRVSDAESASRLANADELFDLIDSDCSGEVDKLSLIHI